MICYVSTAAKWKIIRGSLHAFIALKILFQVLITPKKHVILSLVRSQVVLVLPNLKNFRDRK
jgi:hypothetical protein